MDNLIGLKENVIIGKLIPVGTGMKRYRSIRLNTDEMETISIDELGGEEETDCPEPAEDMVMEETDVEESETDAEDIIRGESYQTEAEEDLVLAGTAE